MQMSTQSTICITMPTSRPAADVPEDWRTDYDEGDAATAAAGALTTQGFVGLRGAISHATANNLAEYLDKELIHRKQDCAARDDGRHLYASERWFGAVRDRRNRFDMRFDVTAPPVSTALHDPSDIAVPTDATVPTDDDDDDDDTQSKEEERRIADARACAYAKRAERQERMRGLDMTPVARGCVVSSQLLPLELVAALRADAFALETIGEFTPSGLSIAARTASHQGFGVADRCVRAVTPDLGGDRAARCEFTRYLDALRDAVGAALGRTLICAEQYYSIHRPGACLPRHMDERHEVLKPAPRGWASSHRRSLSWLFYLSGEHEGGELRAYCREVPTGTSCVGSHEGNLQVGWLEAESGEAEGSSGVSPTGRIGVPPMSVPIFAPVYMDAWRRPTDGPPPSDRACAADPPASSRPLLALYLVRPDGSREWISAAFDACLISTISSTKSSARPQADGPLQDAPSGARGACLSAAVGALAEQLPPHLRGRFSSVEAVPHEGGPPARVVDVSPRGGTLAIFDAVTVPHEVMPTTSGARVAIAGWFHEEQQPFPEWFDERSAPERGLAHGKPVVLGAPRS